MIKKKKNSFILLMNETKKVNVSNCLPSIIILIFLKRLFLMNNICQLSFLTNQKLKNLFTQLYIQHVVV